MVETFPKDPGALERVVQKLSYWIRDYAHAVRRVAYSFIYRDPPAHYLGFVKAEKFPVILIPGLLERWHFLKTIADPLSKFGHPVYVLPRLGYTLRSIPESAKIVRELIDEQHLRHAIVIAHSIGGLIGKYLLAFHNHDRSIEHVIAIASPFGGSHAARLVPFKVHRALVPGSDIIAQLEAVREVNKSITSIYGVFDNHVWPGESCILEGARNIQVPVHGHHTILFSVETQKIVMREVETLSKSV